MTGWKIQISSIGTTSTHSWWDLPAIVMLGTSGRFFFPSSSTLPWLQTWDMHFLTQPMDPEIKSSNFIFPTKHVIPESLKFSHWLSELPKNSLNIRFDLPPFFPPSVNRWVLSQRSLHVAPNGVHHESSFFGRKLGSKFSGFFGNGNVSDLYSDPDVGSPAFFEKTYLKRKLFKGRGVGNGWDFLG